MMRESPRTRRLRSDFRGMRELAAASSVLDFSFRSCGVNDTPDAYLLRFHGAGLERDAVTGDVRRRDYHEVAVELGAAYPRLMPELTWRTPVFHPNISASGVVCLGGYATHWVPSLTLAELCRMLWDMLRYENFDLDSPYNREAAVWVRRQKALALPLDPRPLRDRFGGEAPVASRPVGTAAGDVVFLDPTPAGPVPHSPGGSSGSEAALAREPEILFLE